MARPPSVPVPAYTLTAAIAAAQRIRALRAEPRRRGRPEPQDPDVQAFFPPTVADDSDIDAVVAYVAAHRRGVPDEVLAAELPDRALLVEYQRQRDAAAYQRRILAVLEAGHELHVPPRTYGSRIGLPTRAAVHNRRIRLTAALRAYGQAPTTARMLDRDSRLNRWLLENRHDLLAIADILVDRRDDLLALLPASDQRGYLAEAIDKAGEHMAPQPSRTFAASVLYALYFLRPGGPALPSDDPVVDEAVARGVVLREGYNAVRPPGPAAG